MNPEDSTEQLVNPQTGQPETQQERQERLRREQEDARKQGKETR